MNDDPLPPELARLEQELVLRPRRLPDAGMRQRILTAASQPIPLGRAPMNMMEFAVATAAAVLLCANLSLSLSNQTDCGLSGKPDTEHLAAAALEITQILPETPSREAFLQALPLQWGSYLAPTREASIFGTHTRRELFESHRLDLLAPDK
jgi:hypothetical protein